MKILSSKTYKEMKDKIISLELNLSKYQKDYLDLLDKYNDAMNTNGYLKSENEQLKFELNLRMEKNSRKRDSKGRFVKTKSI